MKIEVAPEDVRRQLDRVLRSEVFKGSVKLQGFLKYVVEQTLAGNTQEIKESVIGLEVYGKRATYDPRYDSTVRVEASKLRSRLEHYYAAEGAHEPVVISVPKGSYVPHFEWRLPNGAASVPATTAVVPTEPGPAAAPPNPPRAVWPRIALAAVLSLLAGIAIGWALLGKRGATDAGAALRPAPRLAQLTEARAFSTDPALSPDGSVLYYSSDRNSAGVPGLWRQSLDDNRAPLKLTGPGIEARAPSVSADGRRIVFRLEDGGGTLALINAEGGAISPLAGGGRRGRNPRFSPRGARVAFWVARDEQTLENGSLFLIDVDRPETGSIRLFAEFAHAAMPVWSEEGDHLLAVGTWESDNPALEYDAWTVSIADGRQSGRPVKSGLFPALAARGFYRNVSERGRVEISDWCDGWLYLSLPVGDGAGIFRTRFQPGKPFSGGPIEQVSGGAGRYAGARAAATTGRLVYSNTLMSYDLYSAPLSGTGPLTRLTNEPGVNLRVSVDRLGRRAAWEQRRGTGGNRLWFGELNPPSGRVLGRDLTPDRSHALVSPDGSQAAYLALDKGKQSIYVESFEAGGKPRRICEDCGVPTDWTGNGSHLLYVTGQQPSGIGLLEVATGKSVALLNHPSYGLYGARFQVNARGDGWMALYADNGPRTRQVFAAPVTAFKPARYQQWVALTDGAHWDLSPAWGPGTGLVYFVSERDGHRCIWKGEFDAARQMGKGDPQPVYHFHTPEQSLMRSISNRGAEALWVTDGRLFFSLDEQTSSLWMLEQQ